MISTKEVFDNEEKYEAKTYQKLPVVASRARGSTIWDSEGKNYVDLSSGYGVAILGYHNENIANAISEQLDRISVVHNSLYNETRSEFLELLANAVPKGLDRFYMGNSGTEAVEAAIKAAVKYTGKKNIISMKNSYHGKTLGSLAITHSEKYKRAFNDIIYKGVEFVPYGDAEAVRKLPNLNGVAAIFVEPVQGEGGVIMPVADYLKELREITEENNIVLVFDEIQSGLGRTGKMWAHEHQGVKPDLMTIGKGIGGGIPMGITAGLDEIMTTMSLGEMSSTLGGNPLACAAGIAVLKQIDQDLLAEISRKGIYLKSRLGDALGNSRSVREVRGIGLMLAIDLRVRFVPILMNLIHEGVIALYSGVSTIRMLPPYVISNEELDLAIERITSSIARFDKTRGEVN